MTKTEDLLAGDDAPPAAGEAKGKHRLELCPFCGAAVGGAVAVEITSGAKPDFAVRCGACDATGPAVAPTGSSPAVSMMLVRTIEPGGAAFNGEGTV